MDNLITKLLKAESEMPQPVFDCENPHFHSKYASLRAINDAILPSLLKHGILLVQSIEHGESDRARLRVWVTDGNETLDLANETVWEYPNMQQFGSAVTYARRYALSAAFNRVADEDDDGNATADAKPKHKSSEWDEIRDLIEKAKRCGLTDEELNAWIAQTFPGVDKRNFGDTERKLLTVYLKSYIKGGSE